MPTIIDYILKLNICLTAVYFFYLLFLRRLTFYNWNRFYLLGYTTLSFIIPLIDIMPSLQQRNLQHTELIQWIPAFNFPVSEKKDIWESLSYWDWAIAILSLGSIFLLIRFLIRFYSLKAMQSKAQLISYNETKIYQLNENIRPFSFGNSIYINTDLHHSAELEEIIKHEFVHVKQKHTMDILWCEWLCILNWFNPFVWLLRNNIKQNLEFIADNKVLQNGINKTDYQYLLLKVLGEKQFAFTTNFNFKSLKTRIKMMNAVKSAKLHLVKFLFLLPLLAVLLLSFRTPLLDNPATDQLLADSNKSTSGINTEKSQEMNDNQNHEISKIGRIDTIPAQKNTPKTENIIFRDSSSVKPLIILDGEEIERGANLQNQISPNDIESVSVLKGPAATAKYGAKGENGVVEIISKSASKRLDINSEGGQVEVKNLNGDLIIKADTMIFEDKALRAKGKVSGTLAPDKISGHRTESKEHSIANGTFTIENADDVVIKQVPGNAKQLKELVVINHKKEVENGNLNKRPAHPYYVLNGDAVTKADIDKLDPNSIKSVEVIKGASAKAYYGEKAKDGAVIITTK